MARLLMHWCRVHCSGLHQKLDARYSNLVPSIWNKKHARGFEPEIGQFKQSNLIGREGGKNHCL
jgi:hypothetical protein